MTHFVIRQGRSDCELCIRGHAFHRCIHWFVETPEGYTLSGPLDSSIEAEGLAHKRGYQPAPSYEPTINELMCEASFLYEEQTPEQRGTVGTYTADRMRFIVAHLHKHGYEIVKQS